MSVLIIIIHFSFSSFSFFFFSFPFPSSFISYKLEQKKRSSISDEKKRKVLIGENAGKKLKYDVEISKIKVQIETIITIHVLVDHRNLLLFDKRSQIRN